MSGCPCPHHPTGCYGHPHSCECAKQTMTDAREIIAQQLCKMAAQGWSGISAFERAAYRTTAHGMIEALTAAGFRILGPDEVDQVTVEKCAEAGERAAYDAIRGAVVCHGEMTTYEIDSDAEDVAAAIRSIGRKA